MWILIILSCCALYLLASTKIVKSNASQITTQERLNQEDEDSKYHIPGDKWTTEAIKDIAYYLRNHKFNEWDHRYYEHKPNESLLGFIDVFPIPQLRSHHWEVKVNCRKDFYKCISYLHSVISTAPYSRAEDSFTINAKIRNETLLKMLYYECKERHTYANKIGLPFDDPTERFQWSVSASYYMCWYTMLEVPALSMIGESCDNFANCLDKYFGTHNHDPRADDNLSFKCAMYSFCPDPCCPMKYIESNDMCYNNNRNPCFNENSGEDITKKVCHMDRKYNRSFNDITSNRWNVSCNCQKGFKWMSEFGMCVDINECLLGIHECNFISQDCVNLPGTYICIYKWEFDYNNSASFIFSEL